MGRLLTLKLDENVISKAQKICFGKKDKPFPTN